MDKHLSKVKAYQRKNSFQFLVTLTGNHGFSKDQEVYIIDKKELEALEDICKSQENQVMECKNQILELKGKLDKYESLKTYKLSDKYDKAINDNDKLRNRFDHLQERFNKSQEEIIQLQKAINRLTTMKFTDRLFNRIPEDVILLLEGKQD